MIKSIILLLFSFLCVSATAQNAVKNYLPADILKVDLSLQKQKELERQYQLLAKNKRTSSEEKELDLLLSKYGGLLKAFGMLLKQAVAGTALGVIITLRHLPLCLIQMEFSMVRKALTI